MTGGSRWRLTSEAEADYEEILRWTFRHFGSAQFVAYAALLDEAISAVAADPDRPGSKDCGLIVPGVRSYHVSLAGSRRRSARHILVYRAMPDGEVQILRLLHDAMDVSRQLTDLPDVD